MVSPARRDQGSVRYLYSLQQHLTRCTWIWTVLINSATLWAKFWKRRITANCLILRINDRLQGLTFICKCANVPNKIPLETESRENEGTTANISHKDEVKEFTREKPEEEKTTSTENACETSNQKKKTPHYQLHALMKKAWKVQHFFHLPIKRLYLSRKC